MEEIIRVENLTHTYGEGTPFCRSAVQDMSLAIYRGEFLGIIGHTGSGSVERTSGRTQRKFGT